MLDRVSHLTLHAYGGGELAVVRSSVMRRLELDLCGTRVAERLPLRFGAAPALESVKLEMIFPSEAAPVLVALASDPNLPALRAVELTVSEEGTEPDDPNDRVYNYPHPGPMAPLADELRRALEQRAGGAVGEWRVEVENEPTGDKRGLIRAWRL